MSVYSFSLQDASLMEKTKEKMVPALSSCGIAELKYMSLHFIHIVHFGESEERHLPSLSIYQVMLQM